MQCLFALIGQGLLEFTGANGATGPDALSAAEKNAAILTARAGAGDPSAMPSICRISSALQYHPGKLSCEHLDNVPC